MTSIFPFPPGVSLIDVILDHVRTGLPFLAHSVSYDPRWFQKSRSFFRLTLPVSGMLGSLYHIHMARFELVVRGDYIRNGGLSETSLVQPKIDMTVGYAMGIAAFLGFFETSRRVVPSFTSLLCLMNSFGELFDAFAGAHQEDLTTEKIGNVISFVGASVAFAMSFFGRDGWYSARIFSGALGLMLGPQTVSNLFGSHKRDRKAAWARSILAEPPRSLPEGCPKDQLPNPVPQALFFSVEERQAFLQQIFPGEEKQVVKESEALFQGCFPNRFAGDFEYTLLFAKDRYGQWGKKVTAWKVSSPAWYPDAHWLWEKGTGRIPIAP